MLNSATLSLADKVSLAVFFNCGFLKKIIGVSILKNDFWAEIFFKMRLYHFFSFS